MALRIVVGSCTTAAAAAAAIPRPPISISSQKPIFRNLVFRTLSSSSESSSNSSVFKKKLILYSKPGCCLCDGLKEKLSSAFSLSGPNTLLDVDLQVRDITSNSEWEKAYQYEIPVLAKVRPDGTEEVLPRLSPRLGVEMIQKKIADALS